ncbi:MucR family transcriptional regulator [Tateyamaria sp.]|nr:MucR family transcriptional regulator [Tateyamaria sp.]
MSNNDLLLKAADIVAAYVSNNELTADRVPELLGNISNKMKELAGEPTEPVLHPPVPISESYTDDFIVCLEDGKKVTLLKRYLAKHFDLTPEQYIKKWGLPDDYPMVTMVYSKKRSKIAKEQGLGKS